MKTANGVKIDYVPSSDLEESPLSIRHVDDLEKLGERVDEFIRSEKARLKIERQFLKSVIDASSYGAATTKAKWLSENSVVEDIKTLLGLKKK